MKRASCFVGFFVREMSKHFRALVLLHMLLFSGGCSRQYWLLLQSREVFTVAPWCVSGRLKEGRNPDMASGRHKSGIPCN